MWPALGLVGAYLCLSLLDVPALLPAWPRLLLYLGTMCAAAVLLWRGLRRVARPNRAMADRRLERESGLRHRPLATLADRPANPGPEQEALWREHVSRLAAQISRLRVGRPRPGLAARDGWALRGGLVVALAAALVIAGPDTPSRLGRAFAPGLPAGPPAPGTLVQGWITPPAYTGLPPVVLRADTAEVSAPAGSRLTVSVTGGAGAPELQIGAAREPFRELDKSSWQAEGELGSGEDLAARVEVQRRGSAVASWTVLLIPDQKPVPAFTEPPGPNVVGGRQTTQSRLAWQAVDDYGLAGVQAELRLKERPDAGPLVVPARLAGSPKSARGVLVPDLTAHPWAGLPVVARLVAKDGAGQTGTSAPAEFTLPERVFHHPVARALIMVRRQLSLTPDERRPARIVIDAIADQPESFDGAIGIELNLRAVSALLGRGRERAVEDAQERMWEMALALEEGGAERTARALEAARQNLRDALDQNGERKAEQAEIDRRIQELREAIQKHMQALLDQARREGAEMPFDPNMPQLDARDLDRLAQELQKSLREGRTDDARRQMAELEKLLEELQNARPEHGEARERRNAERRQQGRQQRDAVQDLVQREGQVLDRSQGRTAESPSPGFRPGQRPATPPQPGGPQAGQQADATEQRMRDAKAQQAMRRALGELMQRFGDLTGQVPAPLGEADQAMREAAQALADGRDAAAGDAARRAIEALQKGGKEMGRQLARQFGRGREPGEEGGDGQEGEFGEGTDATENRDGMTSGQQPGDETRPGQRRSARRDPLGRPLREGTSGSDVSGDVRVPDEMEQARTRAIQEELRRRGADKTRPQPELDYIDRLLKAY